MTHKKSYSMPGKKSSMSEGKQPRALGMGEVKHGSLPTSLGNQNTKTKTKMKGDGYA